MSDGQVSVVCVCVCVLSRPFVLLQKRRGGLHRHPTNERRRLVKRMEAPLRWGETLKSSSSVKEPGLFGCKWPILNISPLPLSLSLGCTFSNCAQKARLCVLIFFKCSKLGRSGIFYLVLCVIILLSIK